MKKIIFILMTGFALTTGGVAIAQLGGAPPGTGNGQPGSSERPPVLPESQPPSGESAVSEARIRAMLEKQGYGDIQNIQKDGAAYTATATKEGAQVRVRVDPQLGRIEEHDR